MEPIILVLLGAGIAHLSSVIMEYRRHRLDRRYGRTERRQAFQVEQLLSLQEALGPLMECAWRQGRASVDHRAPAETPTVHAVRVHRVLVLVEDEEIRRLTHAALATAQLAVLPPDNPRVAADWAMAHQQLQLVNIQIGEQVRGVMRGADPGG